jgi:predicted negative regulator of RcsB-dependent stress response
LAILFGWRSWQGYVQTQAELASSLYEQTLSLLEKGEVAKAKEIGGTVLSKYNNTLYATLVALNLAQQDLKEGNPSACLARLQWVIDQKGLPELIHIARLRKIRILISQEKFDEAKAEINVAPHGEFAMAYTELKGDIAFAQGQWDDARTAYTQVLESKELSREHKKFLELKLDDLGIKGDTAPVVAPTLPFTPTLESAVGHSVTAASSHIEIVPTSPEEPAGALPQ